MPPGQRLRPGIGLHRPGSISLDPPDAPSAEAHTALRYRVPGAGFGSRCATMYASRGVPKPEECESDHGLQRGRIGQIKFEQMLQFASQRKDGRMTGAVSLRAATASSRYQFYEL